jgi:hypothetical protein
LTRFYKIFDRLISSNLRLPELSVASSGEVDMSFVLLSQPQAAESEYDWFHNWLDPNGEIVLSCARVGEGYCLRFRDLADFWISRDCDRITAYSANSIPEESIRHLLVDQVIPRVIAHRGHTVMHCSANQVADGAVLFIGDSGAGKSTLATSLYRQGYPLLSDDCLLLQDSGNDLLAVPSYAGARLWSDSVEAVFEGELFGEPMAHYSNKRRLILPEDPASSGDRLPVQAIFLLDTFPSSEGHQAVTVEPVSGANIMVTMLKNSFQLDMTDRMRISGQFAELGRIVASSMPIFRLKYPHQHDLIHQVHDAVISVVEDFPKPTFIK